MPITASVGETQINVSVSGGVGPAGPAYSLPVATDSVLGGVKIGSGISIDGNGVISASPGYTLPNATTTTLGGVIVPTSGGLSVDGSGNISAAFATTAQAQDLASSTVAMSPLRARDQTLSWIRVMPRTAATANGGGAGVFTNIETANIACGSTANGLAKLYYAGPGGAYQFFHGRTGPVSADWTIPRSLWVRCFVGNTTTNGIARVVYGISGFNPLVITNRAIGFEIRNLRLWMVAHDGSSLTATDTGQNVSAASFDVLVRSDGAGGMSLLYNGTQIATSSGGPSTTDTNAAGVSYECTNGTDTASVNFYFSAAWISVA